MTTQTSTTTPSPPRPRPSRREVPPCDEVGGPASGGTAAQLRRSGGAGGRGRRRPGSWWWPRPSPASTNLLVDSAKLAQEGGGGLALSARANAPFYRPGLAAEDTLALVPWSSDSRPSPPSCAGCSRAWGCCVVFASVRTALSGLGERLVPLAGGADGHLRQLSPHPVEPRRYSCSGDPLQATPRMDEIRARFAPLRDADPG